MTDAVVNEWVWAFEMLDRDAVAIHHAPREVRAQLSRLLQVKGYSTNRMLSRSLTHSSDSSAVQPRT
ncbi:hypothetical protein Poly51_46220 [Rubripirellula tenax]|uniref:Uncharacterized protein n=1 Tax=Rubripirellula tenax TaxID=2528015 RepID=A0A5C6EJN4_9BACT|nr:hypothetical protein [Rubripirellula tenax]TWU48720.1 hypothetical protein Poly51_46220 [Rubripirellula tenax]